jgi:agmatine deiminase
MRNGNSPIQLEFLAKYLTFTANYKTMNKFLRIGLPFFALSFGLNAQEEAPLPKGLTALEKQQMSTYGFTTGERSGITTPPQGNLRNMAEWEETEYLLIAWFNNYANTISSIIEAAVEETKVLIVVRPNQYTNMMNTLANKGIPMTNIEIIQRQVNSVWIRDYAANPVYVNWNDSLVLVDWIYNRPRPDDNTVSTAHSNHLNIPLYQMTVAPTDLVGTGGNWMQDGFGTGFSSKLIYDENGPGNSFSVSPKSEAQVDQIFQDFMGIDRYITMTNLPYDDIHHIDMHMKLLDEETLLVSEYPSGVADGPQIEANLQYVLDNHLSMYGTPYRVIRIPSPPSVSGLYPDNGGWYRTYANQVFINNTVLVPFYRQEYDTIAQRILEEAMPGYNIVGINVDAASGEQLIAAGGAIHCITHSIGVQDPMIISHQRLVDTYDAVNPYQVDAYLSHRSGIVSATVFYKIGATGSYQSVSMTNVSGEDWQALIPAQPAGTEIYYYIQGVANSGKTMNRPMPAQDGYWKFTVLEDPLGNLENLTINELAVYPNPATAITVIPVDGVLGEKGSVELLDAAGRVVNVIHDGAFQLGLKNYFINANDYADGTYTVRIVSNYRVQSQKLVIL